MTATSGSAATSEHKWNRRGEMQRAVFKVLLDHPGGLPVQEVLERAEVVCPPTDFENSDYDSSPGVRRYPKMVRFATITSVKAGWLIKEQGVWRLTDAGREAYASHPDADQFQKVARAAYLQWKTERLVDEYDDSEDTEDLEAIRLEASSHERSRRAWLCRGANVGGTNVLSQWFSEGFCSIGWGELNGLGVVGSRADIKAAVDVVHADRPAQARGNFVGIIDRFTNQMEPGDLVVTVNGPRVYVGEITGNPTLSEVSLTPRRRSVRWLNIGEPALRSQLSAAGADGLRGLMTVTELTPHLREFAAIAGIELDDENTDLELPEAVIPTPDAKLADKLLLPLEWLQETVELLNEKRQIVLYGPPGTGKTFLAQELCKELVEGAGGEFEVVQFHPSYAYEDFFEGLRPRLQSDTSGGIAFEIVEGPLRRMARRASEDPSAPYVLIIDEINRANLAKVFGELYFLLEYRGTSVALQYSSDPFNLPRNLFVIGTMNTADRSIALVDAAMRRRFYFQSLFPTSAPVDGILGRWLERHGLTTEPADLLRELNNTMNDPDFAVGPSYLMTKRVADPGGLERIWRTAILPLLEEHYFGERRNIQAEFGLASLRKRLNPPAPTVPTPPDEQATTETDNQI